MVTFKPNVERWRETVRSELERQEIPLPVDLILALIHVESRGAPGLVNQKSGASGLMQVMPGTLDGYNKQNSPAVSLSTMRSKDGALSQIKVGLWVLAQYWKSAYKYLRDTRGLSTIPTERLAELADLFYVAGPAGTRKKADKVTVPFLDAIAEKFPEWNALPHPRNVFKQIPAITYDLGSISKWLEGHVTRQKKIVGSTALTLAAILVIYWFFMRDKNGKEKTE